jgi:glycine cleavage system pyridoxal-binding protein P
MPSPIFAKLINLLSIAVIDPMLLGAGGLVQPSEFGTQKRGATMIVGEGQHLALAPNYGGPGLGLFGIRYNENDTLSIRSTPGRYIGLGVDQDGESAPLRWFSRLASSISAARRRRAIFVLTNPSLPLS